MGHERGHVPDDRPRHHLGRHVLLVGVIYDRAHHRNLDNFRGLYEPMPLYGGISAVIFFAAMGLPGMCGFVGEFMVVLSTWNFAPGGQQWVGITFAVLAALTVVLTAAYILWTIQRVFMGTNPPTRTISDITLLGAELRRAAGGPVRCCSACMPDYLLLNWMEPSVTGLVDTLVSYAEPDTSARRARRERSLDASLRGLCPRDSGLPSMLPNFDTGDLLQSTFDFLPELILCVGIVLLLVLPTAPGVRPQRTSAARPAHRRCCACSPASCSGSAPAASGVADLRRLDPAVGPSARLIQAARWPRADEPPSALRRRMFGGLLVYDHFTVFLRLFLLGFTALIIWLTMLTGIPDREDSADFYCPAARRDARHGAHGVGQPPAHGLHRRRDGQPAELRPGRLPQGPAADAARRP